METTSSRLEVLAIRLGAFVYVGAFAAAGYLAWMPIWRWAFKPWTIGVTPTSSATTQFAAGFAHFLLMVGPMAGIMAGTLVFAGWVFWDLGGSEEK